MLNQVRYPYCNSEKCEVYQSYETLNSGTRKLYRCATCQRVFSETKGTFLEGLKKPMSLIVKVLKARSEGMGLNAACRVFEIDKNTLLDWELRFAGLKETLMMYALMNTFLVQVIEGDELYTKVGKNVPVEDLRRLDDCCDGSCHSVYLGMGLREEGPPVMFLGNTDA